MDGAAPVGRSHAFESRQYDGCMQSDTEYSRQACSLAEPAGSRPWPTRGQHMDRATESEKHQDDPVPILIEGSLIESKSAESRVIDDQPVTVSATDHDKMLTVDMRNSWHRDFA